jgi:hypothetical protein
MIDPISGQRFAMSWRYLETISSVISSYQAMEQALNHPLITSVPVQRLFRSDTDHHTFQKKLTSTDIHTIVASTPAPLPIGIHATAYGHISIMGAYRVDVSKLVTLYRHRYPASQPTTVDIEFGPTGPRYNRIPVKGVIDCTGAFAAIHEAFQWLPFRNSRGESLTIEAPALTHSDIINNGHWLLPVGNGRYRFGATYMWDDLFGCAQAAGYHQLIQELDCLIDTPYTILEMSAGTRSILADTRPVIGEHPQKPGLWIVGGVGSKGTQFAPVLASDLAAHLTQQSPLHPDVKIDRFFSKYFSISA